MKRAAKRFILVALMGISLITDIDASQQRFTHVDSEAVALHKAADRQLEESLKWQNFVDSVSDSYYRHTMQSLDSIYLQRRPGVNLALTPKIFSGYRSLSHPIDFNNILSLNNINSAQNYIYNDTTTYHFNTSSLPDWLKNAFSSRRMEEDLVYRNMIDDYTQIECAYWDLPVPPRLPEEDMSFNGYLKRMHIEVSPIQQVTPIESNHDKVHWLHILNTGLQFSQAYVSSNWYQGGSNSISLLFNFLWDVTLNPVYHERTMFQSIFSYKLGMISTTGNALHKYTISDDLLQYNLRTGYKAVHNWYYTFTTQFKTQILNNYPADSNQRTASLLSPGMLNMGVGMTYNKENTAKTLKFNASISPLSYNLTTCIDKSIDPTQFNIKPGRRTLTEIGSNVELTFNAQFWKNVVYSTRLFLFTSYKEFTGDWENTLSFRINSFLTTQIYAHLRYDTSSDITNIRWRHWMLKEILSFGLSYNFSTK